MKFKFNGDLCLYLSNISLITDRSDRVKKYFNPKQFSFSLIHLQIFELFLSRRKMLMIVPLKLIRNDLRDQT